MVKLTFFTVSNPLPPFSCSPSPWSPNLSCDWFIFGVSQEALGGTQTIHSCSRNGCLCATAEQYQGRQWHRNVDPVSPPRTAGLSLPEVRGGSPRVFPEQCAPRARSLPVAAHDFSLLWSKSISILPAAGSPLKPLKSSEYHLDS